jgi:acyl-CoA synthetase (AMP-forming)/AMP-acid ligase II
MHAALERAAARFGPRAALLAGDGSWSFRDLNEQANAFAHHLAGLGVQPGTRVALMASNRPEFIVAVNAISKLGAATVLLSPAWKAREVGHALTLTGPLHAVADGDSVTLLAEGCQSWILTVPDCSTIPRATRRTWDV